MRSRLSIKLVSMKIASAHTAHIAITRRSARGNVLTGGVQLLSIRNAKVSKSIQLTREINDGLFVRLAHRKQLGQRRGNTIAVVFGRYSASLPRGA